MGFGSPEELRSELLECRRCARLTRYRETVLPRASFRGEEYWRRPVPPLGDSRARLVIIGLAPAAHGGNRTGRVFTGDESGRFLFRAIFKAGLANQPDSESADDGLVLRDCYITAAVKCAPPDNKPTREEFGRCRRYLDAELDFMTGARAVLALGRAAFGAYLAYASSRGASVVGIQFVHGGRYELDGLPTLFASYHPSPRNTYTKLLTQSMLVNLLGRISEEIFDRKV